MTAFAIDTSLAVPLLVRRHRAHAAVADWAEGHELRLAGHAEAETFSVLTRLPGGLRLDARSAAMVLASGLLEVVHPTAPAQVVQRIATTGVTGGAVYDALVAVAAADAGLPLATRDLRAASTYALVGVGVEFVT